MEEQERECLMNGPLPAGLDPASLRRRSLADRASALLRLAQIYASTHALVGTSVAEPDQQAQAEHRKAELAAQIVAVIEEAQQAGRKDLLEALQAKGVLIVLRRIEDYEDTHPALLAEDAIGSRWPYEVIG
jgi:hypothetical protein